MYDDDREALRELKHRRTMKRLWIVTWLSVAFIAACLIFIILIVLGVIV